MKDIRLKGFAEEVDFHSDNPDEVKHFLIFTIDGVAIRIPVTQEAVTALVNQLYSTTNSAEAKVPVITFTPELSELGDATEFGSDVETEPPSAPDEVPEEIREQWEDEDNDYYGSEDEVPTL